MSAADPDFELASSIADGADVDWEELASGAGGDPERLGFLRALRVISEVGRVHESTVGGPRHDDPSPERLERWGHLEILEKVGEGSFGEVFRARDTQLDRVVALKLLAAGGGAHDATASAIVEEGRLLARVDHPHVATIHGADRREGRVGLWMEFVEGRTLAEVVAENGPLGAREATLVGIDLCAALAAVHARGILHRDIKAQNVMRAAGGRIVLMDFGIGGELDARGDLAGVAGTPLYMAPEVLAGGSATVRSDVYSLGVLLFHLVTGGYPYRAATVDELRRAHRSTGTRLRDLRPELPAAFVEVVEGTLTRDPAERPASAGELERELAALLREPSDGRPSRRTLLGWLTAAGAAAVAGVGAGLLWRRPRSSAEPFGAAREAYERALAARSSGDLDRAILLLESAIENHPRFAPLYATLADYQEGKGQYDLALENGARGDELTGPGLLAAEEALVRGNFHSTRMQMQDALEAYARAEVPDELTASDAYRRRLRAVIRRKTGEANAILGQNRAAVTAFRAAKEIEPEHRVTRGWLVLLEGMSKRFETAFAELAEARATAPDPYYFWGEGLAHLIRDDAGAGDLERAAEAFANMAAAGGIYESYGRYFRAQWLSYQGHLRDAIAEAEGSLPRDIQESNVNTVAMRRNRLARFHALLGEPELAATDLKRVEELTSHDTPTFVEVLRDAGVLYAELGELDGARRILARLEVVAQHYPSEFSTSFAAQVEGELARAEGDRKRAEERLELARTHRGDPVINRSWASLLAAAGRHQEAARVWDGVIDAKGLVMQWHWAPLWVEAHLGLGRARAAHAAELAAAGEPERAEVERRRARESYTTFLGLWRHADPDIPLLAAARRELEALETE